MRRVPLAAGRGLLHTAGRKKNAPVSGAPVSGAPVSGAPVSGGFVSGNLHSGNLHSGKPAQWQTAQGVEIMHRAVELHVSRLSVAVVLALSVAVSNQHLAAQTMVTTTTG